MTYRPLSKAEFYQIRAESYSQHDPEALIRYERTLQWIDLGSKPVVREVGCKFAILRDLLEKYSVNSDYIALDIDEATLKKIPRYNERQFIRHDVSMGLPFANDSTDYLVCLEVMEHLENPSAFLSEVSRVLKSKGKLILSVPNPYCWMEIVQNFKNAPDTEGHISSFTKQNIEAITKFSGLRVAKMMGTYTHIPLSRRFFGKYMPVQTNSLLLTRSMLYLIQKI